MMTVSPQNILIFGGTSEGRILTEKLAARGFSCNVCVATDYGEQILEQDAGLAEELRKRVSVHTGRMDKEQMRAWMKEHTFSCVIDATHPYAVEVTENIRQAAQEIHLPYYRLLRSIEGTEAEEPFVHKVAELSQAVAYLEKQTGAIFLTTGSKEIHAFTEGISDRTRLYVRMLPNPTFIQQVLDAGVPASHLFAMQGPFSVEMNLAMLHQSHAAFLVSKESGKAGGYEEKREAARQAGISMVVLTRPEESGYSLEEILQRLEEGGFPEQESCVAGGKREPSDKKDSLRQMPSITLAGIGMGNYAGMTGEVQGCIRKADLLIGAKRMLEAVSPSENSRAVRFSAYMPEEILTCIRETAAEWEDAKKRHIVILLSGDTGFYSGASTLGQKLVQAGYSYQVFPGISSVSAFAARLKVDWQDAALLSCHGRSCDVLRSVFIRHRVFVLAAGADTVREVAERCLAYDMTEVTFVAGSNLGYPEERILSGHPQEFLDFDQKGNTILYIENPQPEQFSNGIADGELERGKVPMTKEEVRAISVAKLALLPDSIVYDIGAGTGSVTIACGRAVPEGQVYAIEKNPEAVELLKSNRKKLKASNVTIVPGAAPEVLENLPAPTHAFLGGTGGNLAEIVTLLFQKNPQIRIVINAISIETVSALQQLTRQPGLEAEMVTVTVARTREVGSYHLMMGENPIWIVTLYQKGN